jgi:hypothetical protein
MPRSRQDAVIELGAKHGCEFTPEEALRTRDELNILATQESSDELPDADLDSVAGGCWNGAGDG